MKTARLQNHFDSGALSYPERDSNPHSRLWPEDFKSSVSTIPPSGQLNLICFSGAKIINFVEKWHGFVVFFTKLNFFLSIHVYFLNTYG